MLLRKESSVASTNQPADTQNSALSSQSTGSAGEVEAFAREVLAELSKDNLQPYPNYFQLYFEKMLDEKPYEFRKAMSDMMESDSNTEDEKRMKMEQQLQDGFNLFKEILQNVATLFKNISSMTAISKRRAQEAKTINNPSAVQNITLALNNDLEKLTTVLNSQAVSIKNLYTKLAKITQDVKGETIYDSQYGIFNRRYLTDQVAAEISQMGKFNHTSSLIIAKLSSEIKEKIKSEKQLALVNRTISKLFLKTSRRSDVVAHYGDGSFAMLLKHTDELNASRASSRIADMTSGSHFFIADQEIKLEIVIGIAVLDNTKEAESVIVDAVEAMSKADETKQTFVIAGKQDDSSDSDIPQ